MNIYIFLYIYVYTQKHICIYSSHNKWTKIILNKSSKHSINKIRTANTIIHDPLSIAQIFNQHFANVCVKEGGGVIIYGEGKGSFKSGGEQNWVIKEPTTKFKTQSFIQ